MESIGRCLTGWIFFGLMSVAGSVYAQNSITALNVGDNSNGTTTVKVELAQPLVDLPAGAGFTLSSPPRIVLDFPDTANGSGKAAQDFAKGGVRSASIVQADGRTRLVIYLDKMFPNKIRIDGSSLLIALQVNAEDIDANGNALRLIEAKKGAQMHMPPTPAAAPVPPAGTQPVHFPIRGFRLQGNVLIVGDVLQAALKPYIGSAQSFKDLVAARDAVLQVYRSAGYRMVSVGLPETFGADGIITLKIVEVEIGKVSVTGNQFFSETNIREALPSLKEGKSPDVDRLARELFLANDNPSRNLTLNFKEGGQGGADAEIKTVDQSPLRVGMTLDNTGTKATGVSRLGVIVHHSNLWDKGHIASVSYTTSPEKPGSVRQIGLSYQIPLTALGDTLNFRGSYSDVNTGRVADAFNISGQGDVLGVHYTRDLVRDALYKHTLDFGYDEKNYKNTVDFFGTNLGVDVDTKPLSLAYQYSAQKPFGNISAGINYAHNLPGGTRNDDATYNASRAGAKAGWNVWRANGAYQYGWESDWQASASFEGQYTNQPLVSGEQFGLGGAHSVRGFAEREIAGDRGTRLSLEIYAPRILEVHRLLAFIDTGDYVRLNPQPGEQAGEGVAAYGLGWRMILKNGFSATLDWAIVADGTLARPRNSHMLHFNAAWWF